MQKETPSPLGSAQALSSIPRVVLQIEDNEANAHLVEQLLEKRSDLKLWTAINGTQGVEMACALMPDLILMDINMMDNSGLLALKVLRENPACTHIPVVAFSSNEHPHQIKDDLEADFILYMAKPYAIDILMDAIDLALSHPVEDLLAERRALDRRALERRASDRRASDRRNSGRVA